MFYKLLFSMAVFGAATSSYGLTQTISARLINLHNSIITDSKITNSPLLIQNKSSQRKFQTRFFPELKSRMNFGIKKRSHDFPTQVVRFKLNLTKVNLSCDSFEYLSDEFYKILGKLHIEGIHYSAGGGCGMDTFEADVFIDAYTDDAVIFLQKFISENNGADFHGVPFEIESAKGIVVALDISAGIYKEDSAFYDLDVLFHQNKKLYFNNLYDMNETLSNDIENKLMTNNPEIISSFFKQWFGDSGDLSLYLEILLMSNMVKIHPECIFLMDKEPKAYSSNMTWYNIHDCTQYPSGKCLG